MPRNGSGTYAAPANSFNPAVTGNTASPTDWNSTLADISAALTASIAKDGQTVITANLPMAGYKHTNVGAAVNRTDYARYDQLQDASVNWVDGGGTADAITATYNPAISTLIDGQLFFVRATAANATTTPTFSPNGLTARTIVKTGGAALIAGDIAGDGHELILRYDLANTRYALLNPSDADAARKSVNNTFTGTNTFSGTLNIPDGTVSTTAKIVDGIVTYVKMAAAAIAAASDILAGTASKIVNAANLKSYFDTYIYPRMPKAYGNFNGASGGTVLRSGYNVSSVTRSSTGTYSVTFTNALPSADYTVVATSGGNNLNTISTLGNGYTQTTTGFSIVTYNANTGVAVDVQYGNFVVLYNS